MAEGEPHTTTQYLTFTLDREVFAFDISKVREVLDLTTITKVPQTPPFLQGVINLRGAVVPVADMRLKFSMAAAPATVNTCIIIVEVAIDGEHIIMGAMADSVQEVIDLESADIEPPPRIGTKLNVDYLTGMGRHNEQFIMILNIDEIFTEEKPLAVRQVMVEAV